MCSPIVMKVSEKSLELNVGAELLWELRHAWGMPKAYLRGLTQEEERREGVDFFVHLDPSTRIYAFQFKAPKGGSDALPYRYTLVKYQHEELHRLAVPNPGCVFYVFPFYVTPAKLHADVPCLLRDTWLLDARPMAPSAIFGQKKTRTVFCHRGKAKVNPTYVLHQMSREVASIGEVFRGAARRGDGDLGVDDETPNRADALAPLSEMRGPGMSPAVFAAWYGRFREARGNTERGRGTTRRSPWLARGLRVMIVPPGASRPVTSGAP